MKKILVLTISILMLTAVVAKATNPIPSYNVLVTDKAIFMQNNLNGGTFFPTDEKRDINVSNDASGGGNGPTTSVVSVIVYRLDQSEMLGPYVLYGGETLNVTIDNHQWGVIVTTKPNRQALISVWTNHDN